MPQCSSKKGHRKRWDAHHQVRRKAQAHDVEAVHGRQHFAPGCSRVALMPLQGPVAPAGLAHVTGLGAPLRSGNFLSVVLCSGRLQQGVKS